MHRTTQELEAGLETVRQSPTDDGVLEMIVRRPDVDARQELQSARLDLDTGLVGDNWKPRGNPRRPDGSADPDRQLTIMNSRTAMLVAQDKSRWGLAGDQLFVDLDLSLSNLPAGTRLSIGSAVVEVTAPPHMGCAKFVERFGADAMKFVNSPLGRELCLRGINARVVQPGQISVGDRVRRS